MNEQTLKALHSDLTIDFTTTGRHSGEPRRIEIWMLSVDGRLIITGTPGPRDWLANVAANPACVIHLKQRVHADLPAEANVVTDPELRRHVLMSDEAAWYRQQGDDIEDVLNDAPMVEITITST